MSTLRVWILRYGTAQEQVNVLARVGTRNKVHAHANLSHTRGASQTTHAIHEVHVSQHASQNQYLACLNFNDMCMVNDYYVLCIIGGDHII